MTSRGKKAKYKEKVSQEVGNMERKKYEKKRETEKEKKIVENFQ